MPKMVQIRHVPDEVHRILKTRAAQEGLSLSDYLNTELERLTQRPSMSEWLQGLMTAKPIRTKRTAAEVIREMRDAS